jgi:ABC-2 type transport system permease protein
MTAATTIAPRQAHSTPSRLSFGGILRSEWTKLRSLRSTFWCYLFILVINVGFALLVSSLIGDTSGGQQGPGSRIATTGGGAEALTVITAGLSLSALLSAVLGALMITGEYGTGMIKSTFTADPRRLGALFGKALVFGVVTFLVGFVSMVLAALVAAPGLKNAHVTLDWGDSRVWLALVGGAGYLALAGLIAYGLGAIIRSSAGGIAAGIGLLFVVPIVLQIVTSLTQAKWIQNVSTFLPGSAGGKIYAYGGGKASVVDGLVTLDGTLGLLVIVGWVVVVMALATLLVKRRDA